MNSSSTILIIGLGNPGKEYNHTRHNIGFLALDSILINYNFEHFTNNNKFTAAISQGCINTHKIILIKPTTYMNLSGQAVQKIKQYYKIDNNNIIVIHDDIDLNFLQIKIKIGGGHAGHNGLKSIDSVIGQDYWRLRFGIGRPLNSNMAVADYVLANFSQNELLQVNLLLNRISKYISYLLNDERHNIIQHL